MASPDPRSVTSPPVVELPEEPPRVTPVPPPRTAPVMTAPPMAVEDVVHQLPPHRNKVERVADHATGLVDDVKEWVDLRIELVRGEIEAFIDSRVGALRGLVVVGIAAAITGMFALVTLGLGLGALFGRRYWLGFLVLTLLLALGTWLAKRTFAPGKMRIEHSKATGQLKISHEETPAQHEAKKKGRPQPDEGELRAN